MNPIYEKNTLEFVTVALEFCSSLERLQDYDLFAFVNNQTKILPLLYLKATLLPEVEEQQDADDCEHFITEEAYEALRTRLADLLGEHDSYLETFTPDMQYSDTPVIAFISENIADLYQDIGDFAGLFRQGYEETMLLALARCTENFRRYWGQSLLNALKAMHAVRYDEELNLKEEK
ncbi:MAG: DUF5063 domain-containing protein [Tannerella sp.]|jgi:hypothetical protein|nr:DUF5063 domain-containing protein [Tannerella sp.]